MYRQKHTAHTDTQTHTHTHTDTEDLPTPESPDYHISSLPPTYLFPDKT